MRRRLFEPLSRLKFELPCAEVSGAWLGARLNFREGSAPLGYIPGCNWTQVLCKGLASMLDAQGVRVLTERSVVGLHGSGGRIATVELADGERLTAGHVVSTLPTETYLTLAGGDDTPYLSSIRYTAIVSRVCATRQTITPDFYWMSLTSLDCNAGGIFMLNSLNPTIGGSGEACLNFVTHLHGRDAEFFRRSDEQLLAGYRDDFRKIWGFELEPTWTHVTRLPLYSPVFVRGYRNPPVRSTQWQNVYFAGNYRTFPSIASTGTALRSGLEAAEAILADAGETLRP